MMILKNLSIGLPKKINTAKNTVVETAICKESVEEVFLTKNGFIGDGVADLKHHGGPDRAVCVYPFEHYAFWEKEFGQLPKSTFGENLTVTNMLEEDICIGDIFQLGEAVIQITQSRVPCSTITQRTGIPLLLKRMVQTGYTGFLCRVLLEGTVKLDSTITRIEKNKNEVSIMFCNEIYFHRTKDVEGMKRILEVEELADEWKKDLSKRLQALEI